MAKFLLVHGAWHGAWCWRHVTPVLRQAGHEVMAPDLAGLSMAAWVEGLRAVLAQSPGPAILVGHSRGGAVASLVAEAAPEAVEKLIFVSGFLLENGQSVLAAAQQDILLPTQMLPGTRNCVLEPDAIIPHFYADCSAGDIAFAVPRLKPEPLFGLATAVKLSAENFGRVPLYYVECLQDRTISLAAQRRMQGNWKLRGVRSLPTGHCPFFSAPDLLAESLLDIPEAM